MKGIGTGLMIVAGILALLSVFGCWGLYGYENCEFSATQTVAYLLIFLVGIFVYVLGKNKEEKMDEEQTTEENKEEE